MIAVALGFCLAVMAAISLVLLRRYARTLRFSVDPARPRMFKGDSRAIALTVVSGGSGWAHLGSLAVVPSFGIEWSVRRAGEASFELEVNPLFAGRFDALVLRTRATDALGLFERALDVTLPAFAVESLPLAMRMPARPMFLSTSTVGENPAGRKGAGQELYSVESYEPGLETRDILWKRVARATDDTATTIPVRTREVDVRREISISIIAAWRSEEELVKRTDLIAEAVGQIAGKLFMLGSGVELLYPVDGRVRRVRASSPSALADALSLGFSKGWTGDGLGRGLVLVRRLIAASDLVILGREEHGRLLPLTAGKPTLVISGAPAPGAAAMTASFSGAEDLTRLTRMVLER